METASLSSLKGTPGKLPGLDEPAASGRPRLLQALRLRRMGSSSCCSSWWRWAQRPACASPRPIAIFGCVVEWLCALASGAAWALQLDLPEK